ncbi:hypothetical protein FS749_008590 [Ceratobasidium sp. UAMH 11750]|nr:hypothetical protein FS749_008590 [Ceratobasidium sp. UAMH 11750]
MKNGRMKNRRRRNRNGQSSRRKNAQNPNGPGDSPATTQAKSPACPKSLLPTHPEEVDTPAGLGPAAAQHVVIDKQGHIVPLDPPLIPQPAEIESECALHPPAGNIESSTAPEPSSTTSTTLPLNPTSLGLEENPLPGDDARMTRSRATSTSSRSSLPPPPTDCDSASTCHGEDEPGSPPLAESPPSELGFSNQISTNPSALQEPERLEVTMAEPEVNQAATTGPYPDLVIQNVAASHARTPTPGSIFSTAPPPAVDGGSNLESPLPSPSSQNILSRQAGERPPVPDRSTGAPEPVPQAVPTSEPGEPMDIEPTGTSRQASPRPSRWPRYSRGTADAGDQDGAPNEGQPQHVHMPGARLSLAQRLRSCSDWNPTGDEEHLGGPGGAGDHVRLLLAQERQGLRDALENALVHFQGSVYGRALAEKNVEAMTLQYEVMYVERLVATLLAVVAMTHESAVAAVGRYVDEDPLVCIGSAEVRRIRFHSCDTSVPPPGLGSVVDLQGGEKDVLEV